MCEKVLILVVIYCLMASGRWTDRCSNDEFCLSLPLMTEKTPK